MKSTPPWDANELPEDISSEDFDRVSAYFMTGIFRWGKRLIPAHPNDYGWHFRLSGTHYQRSVDRLNSLLRCHPMYTEEYLGCRRKYYPAILLPDPTPAKSGTTAWPIAVCSRSGYIGSAWQDAATKLRPEVDCARADGKYLFTRLRLQEDLVGVTPAGWEPTVWLPCEQIDFR
jgi:hypothetical protein